MGNKHHTAVDQIKDSDYILKKEGEEGEDGA